jgi:hypothetical protein
MALQGTGTSTDPYLIYTDADLRSIGNFSFASGASSAHYKLMNDITMSSSPFTPIGKANAGTDNRTAFAGTFDGNGYSIIDLVITGGSTINYNALFASATSTAVIKNLGLKNPNITAFKSYVAGFVGFSQATVDNCYIEGGQIRTSTTDIAGQYVGGFFGNSSTNSKILNCYIEGTTIAGNSSIGGLFGFMSGGGTVTNSYSAVSLTNAVGNFSGTNTVSGVVFNGDLSSTGANVMTGITKLTTIQMKDPSNAAYNSWDKTNVWIMRANAYPALKVFYRGSQVSYTVTSTVNKVMASAISGIKRIATVTGYPRTIRGVVILKRYNSPTGYYGSGTEQDPYLIWTKQDLEDLADSRLAKYGNANMGAHYKLMNDIEGEFHTIGKDVIEPHPTNGGIQFVSRKFTGTFDGNNRVFRGGSGAIFLSLYYGATIKNLGREYFLIEEPFTAPFANISLGATIENCYVKSGSAPIEWHPTTISLENPDDGKKYMVGYYQYSSTQERGIHPGYEEYYIGGMIRDCSATQFIDCYTDVQITSGKSVHVFDQFHVGGFVSTGDGNIFTRCYSSSYSRISRALYDEEDAFVPEPNWSNLEWDSMYPVDWHNAGNIPYGDHYTGGIQGWKQDYQDVSDGSATDTFFDYQKANISTDPVAGVQWKTTTEMLQASTYANYVSSGRWNIQNGKLPVLSSFVPKPFILVSSYVGKITGSAVSSSQQVRKATIAVASHMKKVFANVVTTKKKEISVSSYTRKIHATANRVNRESRTVTSFIGHVNASVTQSNRQVNSRLYVVTGTVNPIASSVEKINKQTLQRTSYTKPITGNLVVTSNHVVVQEVDAETWFYENISGGERVMALTGDTVRLKARFRTFDGQALNLLNVKLKIYDDQENVILELPLQESHNVDVGEYEYDYTVPEGEGSMTYEFSGTYDTKPFLVRNVIERRFV